MSAPSTTLLADLISKRRRCLVQLRDLGVRQGELISTGNMSDLLRLFAAKQQLIAALQTIEKQLIPFHEEDPDARRWESADARAACARDADDCRRLIEEVMAMETAGEQQMSARRDDVAHQLRTVAAAGRVREAYQAHDAGAARPL